MEVDQEGEEGDGARVMNGHGSGERTVEDDGQGDGGEEGEDDA